MKRIGNLFDAVVEPENLRLAFWKASRGKQHRPDQRAYAARLEEEIEGLRLGLLQGDYPVGEYTRFRVYDPKERVIWKPASNVGLEPGHPGRELEQQRQQRTLPQQQLEQPGQRQQQQRVPGRLPLSTASKLEERTGSPPVSCFRGRNKEGIAA